MANISKCKECGKPVPKENPILTGENNTPMRFCSLDCMNLNYETEAAIDAEGQEFSSRCAIAIKKGEAESGKTFAEAGDVLIMSWLDEYGVYDKENNT